MSIGSATIDLDNRGLVLIDGRNMTPAAAIDTNGTGKSSMLSAIFYALYGEMPNGDKADAVINKQVGKNTSVELEFVTDSGSYKILRTRKKNSLKLYSGEEDLTKGTSKETQSLIDSIVSIPKDIYMSTLYFDGHNSTPFSMLTDKQRKEYLEVLFNVGVYRDAYDVTKSDISEAQEELNNILSSIQIEESKLQPLSDNVLQLKEEKESSQGRLASMLLDIETSSDKLEELHTTLANLKNTSSSKIADIDLSIAGVTTSDTSNLQREVNTLSSQVSSSSNRLASMKATILEKANLMKSLSVSDVCLVCGNVIDENHKKIEIGKITAEINELKIPYGELKQAVENSSSQLEDKKSELSNLQNKISKANEYLSPLYAEKQRITTELSTMESEYQSSKGILDNKREYYDNEMKSSSRYDSNILELENKIKTVQSQVATLQDKRKVVVSTITHLDEALKAFSDKGIKSHVLDLVTPEMNIRANNYLSYLTGGTITAEFSTQTKKANGDLSDKFDIKVTNNGEETTYNSLSSGEQRRVDISISLTLQDILMSRSNTSSNLLIYDELFESLDAVGSESVVELLKTRLDTADTILVVTHNENLKPLFNSSIVAVKETDGITHIENGVLK